MMHPDFILDKFLVLLVYTPFFHWLQVQITITYKATMNCNPMNKELNCELHKLCLVETHQAW